MILPDNIGIVAKIAIALITIIQMVLELIQQKLKEG